MKTKMISWPLPAIGAARVESTPRTFLWIAISVSVSSAPCNTASAETTAVADDAPRNKYEVAVVALVALEKAKGNSVGKETRA